MNMRTKKHPKGRRVEIVCGLCEIETTFNGNGVCRECQRIYRLGKQADIVRRHGEAHPHYLPSDSLSFRLHSPGVLKSKYFSIRNLIESLTGHPANEVFNFNSKAREEAGGRILVSEEWMQRHSASRRWVTVLLTEQQAQVIRDAIVIIEHEIKSKEKSAYRSGSAFITRLAEGSLSIEEINRLNAKAE